jgi:hypothetical protein
MSHGIIMEILDDTDPTAFLSIALAQATERGRVVLSVTRFARGFVLLTQDPEPPEPLGDN